MIEYAEKFRIGDWIAGIEDRGPDAEPRYTVWWCGSAVAARSTTEDARAVIYDYATTNIRMERDRALRLMRRMEELDLRLGSAFYLGRFLTESAK